MKKFLDYNMYPYTVVALLVFLLIIPCVLFLPDSYGFENGLLENLQMFVLLLCVIFAYKAKENKTFFHFAILVIIIIALREVNCGRTLFFPIPGEVNAFYSWKQIKYGYLAHPLYGLYMAYTAFFFLKHKLYLDTVEFLKTIKLPIWNIILMLVGLTLGLYAEKATNNYVFEEISELLFYVSLAGIIYHYAFKKYKKVN